MKLAKQTSKSFAATISLASLSPSNSKLFQRWCYEKVVLLLIPSNKTWNLGRKTQLPRHQIVELLEMASSLGRQARKKWPTFVSNQDLLVPICTGTIKSPVFFWLGDTNNAIQILWVILRDLILNSALFGFGVLFHVVPVSQQNRHWKRKTTACEAGSIISALWRKLQEAADSIRKPRDVCWWRFLGMSKNSWFFFE